MSRKKTIEEVALEIKNRTDGKYILLDNQVYINNKTKLLVRHLECGKIFQTNYNTFDRGSRCPHCFGTHKHSIDELKKKLPDDYEISSEKYINTDTKLVFKHTTCGNIFEMTHHDFFPGGHRCPKCTHRSYVKTTDEFKDEVINMTDGEYLVVGEYENNKTPIKILHTKCGTYYFVTPNDFISGNRCPRCKSSKGEKIIQQYLNQFYPEIEYYHDKYVGCKFRNKRLRFDFYFPREKVVIEYDGEQHWVNYFKCRDNSQLTTTKKYDKAKYRYCKKHGITLIRIPFWKKNELNSILDDIFRNIKNNTISCWNINKNFGRFSKNKL